MFSLGFLAARGRAVVGVIIRQLFLGVSGGTRLRVVLSLAVGVVLLVAPTARAGGNAGYGCPAAFGLGGLTFTQSLALPRVQAGLAAGAFTEGDLTSQFQSLDRNGDGVLCFQDVGALNGGRGGFLYLYNVVDDNASVPVS